MPKITVATNHHSKGEDSTGVIRNWGTPTFGYANLYNRFDRYLATRFPNIQIPQNAEITSAKIIHNANNSDSGDVSVTIYAEASDNTPPFTLYNDADNADNWVSTRPFTTASADWNNIEPWVFLNDYDSADISDVIKEIVNRSGWVSGNAITIIYDCGAVVPADKRTSRVYAYNPLKLEIIYTTPSGGLAERGVQKAKEFVHKIYDKDMNYVATWGKEVVNVPEFKWKINGGMGEQRIELKRPLDDFGEGVDVRFGNFIETWIQDSDQERGKLIWHGRINHYEPIAKADKSEVIQVRATSRMLEMEKRIVRLENDDTSVPKLSQDPSNMLREIINSSSAGSVLKVGNVIDTDTTVSFTFNTNTFLDAFDAILQLTPQHWYYWIEADDTINLKQANYDEIDHVLYVGKEISQIQATKNNETLVNRVYFMGAESGGTNLFWTYERTSSQAEWGLRELFMKDERVSLQATAQTIATRYLDDYDHPLSQIVVEVVDSNYDPINGYDIERFKPGQIVQIRHPRRAFDESLWDVMIWDVDYWDWSIENAIGAPHQIVEVEYEFRKVIITLSAKLTDVTKRIEDINRNLNTTAKENLPSSPT